MFNEKGEVIPISKLPEDLVYTDRYGHKKRKWVNSHRYDQLAAKRRYLYRNQALNRELAHNALANQVIAFGDEFFCEKMNYKALAKRAKETKKSKTGKNLSKKRFGKSVGNKAPAMFLQILMRKLAGMHGAFEYVNTYKLRASQYNHETMAYKKKHLWQRWVKLKDGPVQRDLYSAFLIMCVDDTLANYNQDLINKLFAIFRISHDKALAGLDPTAVPSGTGIRKAA